jgi:hypothetical protein
MEDLFAECAKQKQKITADDWCGKGVHKSTITGMVLINNQVKIMRFRTSFSASTNRLSSPFLAVNFLLKPDCNFFLTITSKLRKIVVR